MVILKNQVGAVRSDLASGRGLRCFFKKSRTGTALIEFALVFPIFILLIFALIDISLYGYYESSMSHVLRSGLRLAVTGKQLTDSGGSTLSRMASMREAAFRAAPPMIKVNSDTLKLYNADTESELTDDADWKPGIRVKAVLQQTVSYLTPLPILLGVSSSNTTYNLRVVTIYKLEKYE